MLKNTLQPCNNTKCVAYRDGSCKRGLLNELKPEGIEALTGKGDEKRACELFIMRDDDSDVTFELNWVEIP